MNKQIISSDLNNMFIISQRSYIRLRSVTLIRYILALFNDTAPALVVINIYNIDNQLDATITVY